MAETALISLVYKNPMGLWGSAGLDIRGKRKEKKKKKEIYEEIYRSILDQPRNPVVISPNVYRNNTNDLP